QLFAAAVLDATLADMTRFDKFTIGWSWAAEYGSPLDSLQLKNMLAYSPLQNVRPATPYPAILLIAAERDERIAPVHSLKLAAAFQSTQGSSAPVLLRVDRDLGAVEAAPMRHLIDLAADRLTFLSAALGIAR